MRRGRVGVVVVVLAVVGAACGKDQPACFAGDYHACDCSDGASGWAVCVPDQNGYSGCSCDGTTPGLTCKPNTGTHGFLDTCVNGAPDCASCVCGFYQKRGGYLCTLTCKSDADCPGPSPGCNPQHQCRAP
jgi:hypothetical protein